MSISIESYFQRITDAWNSKSGDNLVELLSLRHTHAENDNLDINNAESECIHFFYPLLYEIIAAHLRCISELRKKDYSSAYKYQMQVVQNLTKEFQNLTDENWLLATINTVCLELRLIATRLMAQPGTSSKPLETAAECCMACFRICTTDKATYEYNSKKWGMISLVNQMFKIYFRINKLNMMKPLIRAVDSSQLKDRFTLSQQITYGYYVGRMAVLHSDYSTANEYLTYAFVHCHKLSKKNKKLILLNLVPVKMLLGYMPTKMLLEKYDLPPLWEVVLAVKRGSVSELSNTIDKHKIFFMKSGIYLAVEMLKMITYRNLFKRVYSCLKTHQIPMYAFLVALRLTEDESMELEEAHCILATLIFEGRVKGYISLQHQTVVLNKFDPIPKLITLNSVVKPS